MIKDFFYIEDNFDTTLSAKYKSKYMVYLTSTTVCNFHKKRPNILRHIFGRLLFLTRTRDFYFQPLFKFITPYIFQSWATPRDTFNIPIGITNILLAAETTSNQSGGSGSTQLKIGKQTRLTAKNSPC